MCIILVLLRERERERMVGFREGMKEERESM